MLLTGFGLKFDPQRCYSQPSIPKTQGTSFSPSTSISGCVLCLALHNLMSYNAHQEVKTMSDDSEHTRKWKQCVMTQTYLTTKVMQRGEIAYDGAQVWQRAGRTLTFITLQNSHTSALPHANINCEPDAIHVIWRDPDSTGLDVRGHKIVLCVKFFTVRQIHTIHACVLWCMITNIPVHSWGLTRRAVKMRR